MTEEVFASTTERARGCAEEMRTGGRVIEFLGAVLVLNDEVAFWRFACDSAAAVEELSQRAGLTYERVLECLEIGGS